MMLEGYSSFELIDVLAEKWARFYLNHYLSQKYPFPIASPVRNWERELSLQKYLNTFNLHIEKTLKKNLFNRRASIWPFQSATNTQFAKRARSKIRYFEFNWVFLFDGMMEWQNLFSTWTALLETKVSKKWNCNEIRKWFIMKRKNWKKHKLIVAGARRIER